MVITADGSYKEDFSKFAYSEKFIHWDEFKITAGASPKLVFEQVESPMFSYIEI